MKSHCACLIKMTLISTEHFPKRFHLLWMDVNCKRSSQQKKRRGLPSSGPSNRDVQIKSTEDRAVQMHCEELLRQRYWIPNLFYMRNGIIGRNWGVRAVQPSRLEAKNVILGNEQGANQIGRSGAGIHCDFL